jgi:hypothetical protein
MVHRLAIFTVVSAVLCVIGIPMFLSYEMACKRLGPSCGNPSSRGTWVSLPSGDSPAIAETY